MKTYNRRIGFLISDQHLIAHGGIGQFTKSFVEMCNRIKSGWKVDVILDKAPTGEFYKLIESLGANIVYPKEPLKYSDHTATFVFSDTINFEKIINFRNAILQAFETNLYDMLICNTQEAMSAAYALSIHDYIPVMFYTHSPNMIFRDTHGTDAFLDSYHVFYNKHMEFEGITIGTQSQKNVDELEKHGATNVALLRMPMSERNLLVPYTGPKSGVLFIGRWEERKNPQAYIDAMKECGLPCKVMTNSNGAKKFEKAFAIAGITNFDIRIGITGKEKVEFIKTSKVFFMPSLHENYPFAFSECLGHMPCVVLDNQNWSDQFDSRFYVKCNIRNAARVIQSAYDTSQQSFEALSYIRTLDSETAQGWIHYLNSFSGKRSNSSNAKINSHTTVKYRDFIVSLDRSHLAREDFESVLSNRHKFINVLYSDKDTYLSKDPTFLPKEEAIGRALFQGL